MIIIKGFPLPPSSNKLYSAFKGRLVKSKGGREYDVKVDVFKIVYKRKLEAVKNEISKLNTNALKVSCIFVFHKNRIIGQKGQVKKLDVTNRVKQVHDNLAKIIEIDDCHFFETPIKKVICESEKDEQVIIIIEPSLIEKYEEMKI